ncbi:Vms1/Ankzf1 family peptidyl-tRNA hydrolase [Chloroflexota bacterium]
MTLVSRRRILTRSKMLDFLQGLENTVTAEARSLYLSPEVPSTEVTSLLKEMPIHPDILPEITELAESSKNGAALFFSPEHIYMVLPPFPFAVSSSVSGFNIETLNSRLRCDYTIALILVRLGAYAVGVCSGEKLLSSKVGTGLVHGKHKKGGSSQQRFARHREKQIEYFMTRVCQHAHEHLQTLDKKLDYMVYGGAWTTIQLLQKQCHFLGQLDTRTLPPLLDIPEPRKAVLTAAITRIWSSTLIEWTET